MVAVHHSKGLPSWFLLPCKIPYLTLPYSRVAGFATLSDIANIATNL